LFEIKKFSISGSEESELSASTKMTTLGGDGSRRRLNNFISFGVLLAPSDFNDEVSDCGGSEEVNETEEVTNGCSRGTPKRRYFRTALAEAKEFFFLCNQREKLPKNEKN
jgi:hypothetical protein